MKYSSDNDNAIQVRNHACTREFEKISDIFEMKSGLVKTRLNPMLEKIGFCADYSIKIVET